MKCDCPEWKPNIEILDGMIVTQTHMAWGNKAGYTGKPFVYCPWCAGKLKVEESDLKHIAEITRK
jgi:hypothetical protein